MNGSGTLTISNINQFTGGAIVNSGVLKPQNYGGLGSGVVTLHGGTLELPTTGSAVLGLSNNINVATSSTLQYDQTGTFSSVIFGGLSGSPGANLTISLFNNNSGSLGRMRLYGAFTN